jgi:ribosome modulation factor
VTDPFLEGMDAFGRGVPLAACPYPDGSDERELWLTGWDEAKRLNEDGNTNDDL